MKTMHLESDPYRTTIEPEKFQEPTVGSGIIILDLPINTFRLFFKIEQSIVGNVNIKFKQEENQQPLMNKYNEQVTSMNAGYYIAIYAEGFVVLLNDEGFDKTELLKYDLIGSCLNDIYSRIDSMSPEGRAVRTVNLRMPDGSGNVNTGFATITPQLPTAKWGNSVFLEGTTEFISIYNSTTPQWYNLMYPTETVIPDGSVAVRTIKDSNNQIYMQQIDSVKDGVFEAQFFRIGLGNGEWDELQVIDNGGGIQTINGELPDIDGNINISNLSDYKIITPIPPTEPQSEYPVGTSAFLTYYEKANMSDWEEVFDNPDVPDGEMFVVTVKDDSIPPTVVHQRVDMTKDGVFVAEFVRTWDNVEEKWSPLMRITYVESIDGVRPNIEGEITLPRATSTQYGLTILSDTASELVSDKAVTPHALYEVHNDLLTHMNSLASTTNIGHVKIDGTSIEISNDGTISANASGIVQHATDTIPGIMKVLTSLNSTDTLSALSAERGKYLNDQHVLLNSEFDAHKVKKASTTELGHVMVDNETIFIDSNGKITSVGSGSNIEVVDNLTSTDTNKALSANQGKVLNDAFVEHTNVHASKFTLGHVRVDEETILIDAYGTISSVGTVDIIDNLVTSDADKALSANQGVILNTTITNHVGKVASNTELGHVMVDNDTIVVDGNGKISIGNVPVMDYKLEDNYYEAFIDEGDIEVIFNINISDINKVVIKFLDQGMIMMPTIYTYSYDSVTSDITFTLNNPLPYPLELCALVTEVVAV